MLLRATAAIFCAILTSSNLIRADELLPEGAIRFGYAKWRHGNKIVHAALSPDGRVLATATNSSVVVWDLESGDPVRTFLCGSGQASSNGRLHFSPDGRRIAYRRGMGFARVCDVSSGREMARVELESTGAASAFSKDSKLFLVSDFKGLMFWDVESGMRARRERVEQFNLISPDLKLRGTADGTRIVLHDMETGAETLSWRVATFHDGLRNGVAFSPDGFFLAVVDNDQKILIRELLTGRIARQIEIPETVLVSSPAGTRPQYRIAITDDSQELLFMSAGGSIHRWELSTGKARPVLSKHLGRVMAALKTPNGKLFVSVAEDGVIRRWDAMTGKELAREDGPIGPMTASISPSGRFVAVADGYGRLDLHGADGRAIANLRKNGPRICNIAFSPNDQTLAASEWNGRIRLWELPSILSDKTPVNELPATWDFTASRTLQFSADGAKLLAHGYSDEIRVIVVATRQVLWADQSGYACANWTNDCQSIAAVRTDNKHPNYVSEMSILDAATGMKRFSASIRLPEGIPMIVNSVHAIAGSDSGRVAISMKSGHVIVFDSMTGKERFRFLAVPPDSPHTTTSDMPKPWRSQPMVNGWRSGGKTAKSTFEKPPPAANSGVAMLADLFPRSNSARRDGRSSA